MKMRTCLSRRLLLVAFVSMATAFFPCWIKAQSGSVPKYIFYMIGDGMGVGQCDVGRLYLQGKSSTPKAGLTMDKFPVQGKITTGQHGGGVTDSAAAGTALASGQKTKKGVIGLMPDKKTKLQSVAVDARERGMKVGIVTSVPLDHATPASFYAHQSSRHSYYEIACQLPSSEFDYFAGEPFKGTKGAKGRATPAGLAKKAGYSMLEGPKGLAALRPGRKTVWQVPLGFRVDQDRNAVRLATLVEKGVSQIRGPKGFFMLVEGGRIDWAGHANNLVSIVHEVLDFDEAVKVAYRFYEKYPRETLIIVTADHETGGLKVGEGSDAAAFSKGIDSQQEVADKKLRDRQLGVSWATKGHTGAAVPLAAIGASSEKFAGATDNTDLPRILRELISKTK